MKRTAPHRLPAGLLVGALLLGASGGARASPTLDGAWQGHLACSENLLNGGPAYRTGIVIGGSGTAGAGVRNDPQTTERFELELVGHDRVQLRSTGQHWHDGAPRWFTHLEGDRQNGDRLSLAGRMLASDGRTVVRERCTAELLRTTRTPPADHRSLRLQEVTPIARPLGSRETRPGPGGLPRSPSHALYMPEDWLTGLGQPWHFRSAPRPDAPPVPVRAPTAEEAPIVERARALMGQIESRVMVLMADGAIVAAISTGGIEPRTRLLSASMGKTVTALAAGKAVCAGHLALDTRADALVGSLAGTDLGAATLHDLLRMASGTVEPSGGDYVGTQPEEIRHHLEGPGNLEQLLASPRQSSAHRGFFGGVRPGERFSYKSRDPYTVAMMIERAAGMPATRWVDEQLLGAFGAEYPVTLGTDRAGYFHGASGSVRMALIDWVRLARYVDDQRRSESCFGRFVEAMGRTQISAPGVMNGIRGYGYLTWTDNQIAPGTFWAAGYGGQRIGWSTDPANRRVFLLFSNAADREADAIYRLARAWFALGEHAVRRGASPDSPAGDTRR